MLSEAIHSTVDTGDRGLLLYGSNRANRPPDELHPFGHGMDLIALDVDDVSAARRPKRIQERVPTVMQVFFRPHRRAATMTLFA